MFTPVLFDDVDPAAAALFQDLAAEQLAEDNPRLDPARGILGEVVVFAHAVLAGQFDAAITQYQAGRSLRQINADPTAVLPDAVDDVLANYRVRRPPGTRARGVVTVVVQGATPLIIAAGAVFIASAQRFVAERVYTVKPATLSAGAGDLPLRALGGGQFAFDVPVAAEAVGGLSVVRHGALVVPAVLPPGYVNSYAAGDFAGGYDAATNEEMLLRLQEGVAAATPSNRMTLRALLRADDRFSRVVRSSAIGCGAAEMNRDAYWLFPIAGGGKVDWYVRTANELEHTPAGKTAVRIGTDAEGMAVMQCHFGRDEQPGFYEVAAVRPLVNADDTGSFAIVADLRSTDLSPPSSRPDVRGAVDTAYSRYQATILQFVDDRAEAPALGESADYVCELVGLPLLAALHDYATDPARDGLLADLLVRAPVPCFVKMVVTITRPTGSEAIDAAQVASAAAATANNVDFVGRLYASAVADAVYNVLPGDARVAAIDMVGRLRYPDGRLQYLRSGELLEIPDLPLDRVTAHTTQFFCLAEDVQVSVEVVPGNPG